MVKENYDDKYEDIILQANGTHLKDEIMIAKKTVHIKSTAMENRPEVIQMPILLLKFQMAINGDLLIQRETWLLIISSKAEITLILRGAVWQLISIYIVK